MSSCDFHLRSWKLGWHCWAAVNASVGQCSCDQGALQATAGTVLIVFELTVWWSAKPCNVLVLW